MPEAALIDAHTHVFPPAVIARRDSLLAGEPAFAEIYTNPEARMATADELLAEMDTSGVARAVVCNFAWREEALVDETNAYILEAAAASAGRLIPFVSVFFGDSPGAHGRAETDDAPSTARNDFRTKVRRLASAGARGIGELRPESIGFNLANSDEGDLLGWAAAAFDLPLLLHVTEPVGHAYGGKQGLSLESLYRFIAANPAVTTIAAHWGGGLPFYALMPEVRDAIDNVWFDTSASHLLYDPAIYRRAIDVIGAGKIVWGSDFPLTTQAKSLERLRDAGITDEEFAAIAGANVARALSL